MSTNEFLGSLILVGMSLVVVLVVFLLLRGPARQLMGMNSRLAEARPFFVRVLFVTLALAALAVTAGKVFALPDGSALMEYVWQAAGTLNSVIGWSLLVVASFAVILTVLLLGLGRHRDQ
jgi:hypothetical protein